MAGSAVRHRVAADRQTHTHTIVADNDNMPPSPPLFYLLMRTDFENK